MPWYYALSLLLSNDRKLINLRLTAIFDTFDFAKVPTRFPRDSGENVKSLDNRHPPISICMS